MSIQDLGSIGELVAAIATVITLAYLAVQIRQGTKATRQAAVHSTVELGLMLRVELIREPEVAAMYLKGLADHRSLSPEDLVRFNMLLHSMFENIREIYEAYRRGDIEESSWRAQGTLVRWLVARPGGEWAWKHYNSVVPSEFGRAMDSLVETLPDP